MKIGITGGTGYIGSILAPLLLEKGLGVRRLDLIDVRPPAPSLIPKLDGKTFRFIGADVSDPAQVRDLVKEYDFIIHLAAIVGYPACNKNPELARKANVETTRNLLRHKKAGARLFLASTVSNYGEQPASAIVDEKTVGEATTVYTRTKKEAEELVLSERGNLVYRFTTGFGCSPTMRDDVMIHDFVGKATRGESLSVYENTFIRQFVHVKDMAGAIAFGVQHWNRMAGEMYNVGHPAIEFTKKDLVEKINAVCPFPFAFEDSGKDLEKRNYRVSFEKLLRLGFRPTMNLEAGLAELVTHYKRAAIGEKNVG